MVICLIAGPGLSTNAVLTLLALGHCLLLAVACTVFGGYKTIVNRLMAFALLAEAVRLVAVFLYIRTDGEPGSIVEYLMLARVVLAPTLYLYTRALTEGEFQLRAGHLVHALPLLVSDLVLFWNHQTGDISRTQMTLFQALMTAGTFLVYGALSLRVIARYRDRLRETFSDIDRHQLNWLQLAQWYLVIIGLGYVGAGVLYALGMGSMQTDAALMISILTTTTFIYILSIAGLLYFRQLAQRGEQTPADELHEDEVSDSAQNEKYSTGLTSDEVSHYFGLLEGLMNSERPYLEHKVKLADVGGMLGLHPQQISQIINQGAGVPFHDFINEYRVHYAEEMLQQQPDKIQRITDLYEDCGFSSQSTFYKHFKRVTGHTPRQYIENLAPS